MKKGLLFIIVLAIVYWAIYFISVNSSDTPQRTAPEDNFSAREASAKLLEATAAVFRQVEGRHPHTLYELVEQGYIDALPDDGGEPFEYDPNTGRVR